MISINNKSSFKTVESYLSAYRDIFHKLSFKNFTILICAMLCVQEVRSIRFIYDKFIKRYWNICLNSFYYFLADKNLDVSKFMLGTVGIFLSLIPDDMKDKLTIYLLVDDTLQAKFGQKFDCYSKMFDHAKHNGSLYLNGHCFVSLALSLPIFLNNEVKYITLPIVYRLYDKLSTKLEMAAEIFLP